MPIVPALLPLLACPACSRALTRASDGVACLSCRKDYPLLAGVPWLFPEPRAARHEWRERLHFLLQHERRQAASLRAELEAEGLGELTRARLELLAGAHLEHAERLAALLAPLGIGDLQTRFETQLALRTRLPPGQGLSSYYANLHRDWAWGDAENGAACELVSGALGSIAGWRLLVVGSGGGRLAWDLHQGMAPELTVALDFNPLLTLAAAHISAGGVVELYEFPIAPRRTADEAILRRLAAPAPTRPGLHWLLADALHAPLAAGQFDAVVTPWFIDIVPDDLPLLARRLNRLLKPGGRWVNFGSLAFTDRPAAQCYTLEEIVALLPAAGFRAETPVERRLPYMQSPASRHGRVEEAVTFAAVKQAECQPPPPHSAVPEWLLATDRPVPALPQFREQSLSTRVYAFIMAMIDGQRTIRDMAALMEQQQLMPRAEAEEAIRGFLTRMLEDAQQRSRF